MSRVALATCAELPEGDEDFPALIAALEAVGIRAEAAVWDDPSVDWGRFDLVLPRATWDYAERRDDFLAWAAAVPQVLNPLAVLKWNTDKARYLADLAAAGVPIVPTAFVAPGATLGPQPAPFVVKPAVSAGGRSSAWFEPGELDAARALVDRIHGESRTVLVQPYLDAHEERALAYVDGRYSHALRRRVPLPRAGDTADLYLEEELVATEASAAERSIAEAALACAPEPLLYGRVDLFGDAVLELELAEPSLYLGYGAGAAERLAVAIAARLSQPAQ